jgi:hypothetical protein
VRLASSSFDGRIVRKFTLVALLAEALLEKRAEDGFGIGAWWKKSRRLNVISAYITFFILNSWTR